MPGVDKVSLVPSEKAAKGLGISLSMLLCGFTKGCVKLDLVFGQLGILEIHHLFSKGDICEDLTGFWVFVPNGVSKFVLF